MMIYEYSVNICMCITYISTYKYGWGKKREVKTIFGLREAIMKNGNLLYCWGYSLAVHLVLLLYYLLYPH